MLLRSVFISTAIELKEFDPGSRLESSGHA